MFIVMRGIKSSSSAGAASAMRPDAAPMELESLIDVDL